MNQLEFFALTEEPFRLTPDRSFFFPARGHRALSEVLTYGLNEGEGFLVIAGEVGCGKTLMLKRFMDCLDQERFESALILSPHLSPRELILAIVRDLGLPAPKSGKDSLYALLNLLDRHLSLLASQGKRLVIIIDEAQNLPEKSLEQLRLLSNFETDTRKLLQIVLFGQPELRDKLARPGLRQFAQRVSIMENLGPLDRSEIFAYVRHRLEKSGGRPIPFTMLGAFFLWRFSRGYPRLINKIMARALLIACGEKKRFIDGQTIREAVSSFNSPARAGRAGRLTWPGVAALTTLALLVILAGLGLFRWPAEGLREKTAVAAAPLAQGEPRR